MTIVKRFIVENFNGNTLELTEADVLNLVTEMIGLGLFKPESVPAAPAPLSNSSPAWGRGEPGEWMDLALSGKKVEAIRVLRARLGLGLKEAKNVAEKFCDFNRLYEIEQHLVNLVQEDSKIPF